MSEALLSLSLNPGPNPLYRQIVEQVIESVREGSIKAGQRLPSSRVLAKELQVSRSVVVQAYDQLLSEGILRSQAKCGVYVAETDFLALAPITNNRSAAIPKLNQFDAGPDLCVFPTQAWAKCMRQAWLKPDLSILGGAYPFGYLPLQEQISQYLLAHRGLKCSSQQIIVTSGVRESLALVRHCLRELVSQWWVEEPTFPPIRAALDNQSKMLPVKSDGTHPPKAKNWAAVLTPSRQYPLGMEYSHERREEWLAALAEEQGFVVEDDYDNDFCYQGRPAIPLMQAAQNRGLAGERIFFIGTFSKVLFRGLRLGFVVAPLTWSTRIRASHQALGQSAALPMQPVLSEFIASGEFYRHINRMRRLYKIKRDGLAECLEQRLSPWFSWEKPKGGMHFTLFLKRPFWENEDFCLLLQQHAQQRGLKIFTLQEHFQTKSSKKQGIILGFTGTEETSFKIWVDILAEETRAIAKG